MNIVVNDDLMLRPEVSGYVEPRGSRAVVWGPARAWQPRHADMARHDRVSMNVNGSTDLVCRSVLPVRRGRVTQAFLASSRAQQAPAWATTARSGRKRQPGVAGSARCASYGAAVRSQAALADRGALTGHKTGVPARGRMESTAPRLRPGSCAATGRAGVRIRAL